MSDETTKKSIPPVDWKRNEYGLVDHIEYVFREDGKVDWRKMIKPEFLVVHKEAFIKRGQTPPTSIEGLEDKDLLILLGGIKELAQLRGYTRVYPNAYLKDGVVQVATSIDWIPNYETSGNAVEFTALADATVNNTTSFAKVFLSATAENRGFVRAVRNFLGINVVGYDEVGGKVDDAPATGSQGNASKFLTDMLDQNKLKWENVKNLLVQQEVAGAETWDTPENVPDEDVFTVIAKVKTRLEERKREAEEKAKAKGK